MLIVYSLYFYKPKIFILYNIPPLLQYNNNKELWNIYVEIMKFLYFDFKIESSTYF